MPSRVHCGRKWTVQNLRHLTWQTPTSHLKGFQSCSQPQEPRNYNEDILKIIEHCKEQFCGGFTLSDSASSGSRRRYLRLRRSSSSSPPLLSLQPIRLKTSFNICKPVKTMEPLLPIPSRNPSTHFRLQTAHLCLSCLLSGSLSSSPAARSTSICSERMTGN